MGLAVRSLFWAVLFPGLFAGFVPWRYEEPALRGQFGTAYERYATAVGRWLPRRRAWRDT